MRDHEEPREEKDNTTGKKANTKGNNHTGNKQQRVVDEDIHPSHLEEIIYKNYKENEWKLRKLRNILHQNLFLDSITTKTR